VLACKEISLIFDKHHRSDEDSDEGYEADKSSKAMPVHVNRGIPTPNNSMKTIPGLDLPLAATAPPPAPPPAEEPEVILQLFDQWIIFNY
jgi:hypothetical protein